MKNNYSRLKWVALIIIAGMLLFLAQAAMAGNKPLVTNSFPQQEIIGKVTNMEGVPLIGVTVMVKGTNTGTITNLEGIFRLSVPPNSRLVFSFIGYKTFEIPVTDGNEINVQLEEDIATLGEVQINAGYYNTTRRESTGNISRITAEEIELQPVVSPLQALQGRMAGVEVSSGGVNPGGATTIRIRGINSLRSEGNYPLYIIDGVPINSTPIETNSIIGNTGLDPLNTLNVSNIESIEVLKDADATAIYGSRGANGVILITTKTGKQRETGLEARIYTGVSTMPNRLNLLNTEQYLEIRRTAFENDGVEPNEFNAYDLVLFDQNRYTDWQDFLFGGTAETTNANLAFSGGNENTSFRIGGSYFTQGTVYTGNYNYHKITGDISLNHRSKDNKFNINLSLNYGVDVNRLVGNVSLNSATFLLPPNAPSIFNNDGSLNWEDWGEANLDNPLKGYFNATNTESNNLISNVGLSYELFKGLKLKTTLGYSKYDSDELWKLPSRSYNPADASPNSSFHLSSNRNSWILEPQLIYESQLKKLNIAALIGATLQENKQDQQNFQATGYASESLIGNIAAAEKIINATNTQTDYKYSALFSRLGINWDKKYYINLTGRRDGSSRFGPNNRFANFGAVGVAWIFTEEPWVEKLLPFLSFGKLRGSYGTTGNDQIGDYGYLDAYEATVGPGGLYPTALANPDYSWEVNKKLEAGIELGLLDDKIRLGLSRYRNRSSNQLVGYTLPSTTGFNSVQANLRATVQNSGWELEANSVNVETKNFRWQTALNISFPKNELLSYPNIEQSTYANTYRVGHPLNISLLYEYTGLDPETGLYTIRDVNEDGSFDFQDRIIIQDQSRKFYGGINNNLLYKGFTLQFLWEFVKQNGRLVLFDAGAPFNILDLDDSSLNGQNEYQTISQSFQANRAYSYVLETTFPNQDASFLRLKTLSLGYNLPKGFIQSVGLKQAKIFMQAQNLLTLTPYKGLDPEFPTSTIGFGNLRTISGGLQINL